MTDGISLFVFISRYDFTVLAVCLGSFSCHLLHGESTMLNRLPLTAVDTFFRCKPVQFSLFISVKRLFCIFQAVLSFFIN